MNRDVDFFALCSREVCQSQAQRELSKTKTSPWLNVTRATKAPSSISLVGKTFVLSVRHLLAIEDQQHDVWLGS